MKKKILLIDDDRLLRMSMQVAFEAEGYDVVEAENGKSGLEIIKNNRPDMIICDIKMPEMDGLTLLKIVKADPTISAIPFYMLTSLQEEIVTSVETGAEQALFKSSVTPKAVVTAINSFFSTTSNP